MPLASTLRMAALALFWGSGFLWIKLALSHGLTPAQITIARCALGSAVLLVLARRAAQRLPRSWTTWRRLVVAALFCNALPFALFAVGEQHLDSGLAGVLNATTPLWSLLIGMTFGGERITHPVRLTGLGLGFAGTVLIFAPWHHGGLLSRPALALLAAAASYAVAFAYMARHLTTKEAPLAMSAAQLLTATGLSALALPVAGPLHPDATALLAVTALGVLGTGVTFYLNYRLIADEGPTSAATVGYLLPVVSVTLGATLLDEHIGPRVLAGMTVVLVAVAMTRTGGRAAARPLTTDGRGAAADRVTASVRETAAAGCGASAGGGASLPVPTPPQPGGRRLRSR
ncbi:DMT family transporter [Streptomyces sp. IBSBF 2806]|uniref:DMT family transporter n=1 Tax=Streptomyces sp. IBSBF 2806 TaxID=2903529 RepID=UPI002FDBE48D